jgi:capsular polysaccharide biosynthesis protein
MRAPVDVPRLRDYVSMLGRTWPVILIASLLSAGAAVAAVEMRPPSYTASALAWATVAGDPSTFSLYYGNMGAKLRMPGYVEMAKSTAVARRAVQELDSTATPEDLASRVTAEWVPGGADERGRANSALMRITVTSDSPEAAVEEVNAVGGNLVAMSQELEWFESAMTDDIQYKGPVAELLPVGVAQSAQEVATPILGPLAIGAGVGLAVSVLIMLATELGRDTLTNRGQLDNIAKLATQRNT